MLGANLSNILEVAIGLAFVFSVLSLLVSLIGEFASSLFGLRSSTLRAGVESLAGSETAERLYDHALVRAQARPSLFNRWFRSGDGEARPSYLNPQTVATALLDELREDGAAINGHPTGGAVSLSVKLDETREDIVAAINQLPTQLRDQLRPVVESAMAGAYGAGQQLEAIQEATAVWFDQAMDRVSGWYRRRIQLWLFVIGLGLAALFNVDSLFIADELYDEPELRAAVVESATRYIEVAPPPAQPDDPQPGTEQNLGKELDALVLSLVQDTAVLETAGIPMGWDHITAKDDFVDWSYRILGWIVTALAVSLGAPFWFDLLSKLVSLRATGKKLASTTSTE